MAATINVWSYFSATIDGRLITGGSLEVPVPVALTSDLVHERVLSIAQNITRILFNNATDLSASTSFKFLWIQTDIDVILEFITNLANDVGDEIYTMKLKGTGTSGKYGLPLVLGYSASYALYTAAFAAGTLDDIDKISAKNLETTTAKVRIIVAV